jgi:hypothetical protein
MDYFNANFGEFNSSEKSILFNMLSKLVDSKGNVKLNELLFKLECDFYDNIEKLSLLELHNYNEGFYLYRSSNLQYLSKTLDAIYHTHLNVVNNYFKDKAQNFRNFKAKRSVEKVDAEIETETKMKPDEIVAEELKVEVIAEAVPVEVSEPPRELSESEKKVYLHTRIYLEFLKKFFFKFFSFFIIYFIIIYYLLKKGAGNNQQSEQKLDTRLLFKRFNLVVEFIQKAEPFFYANG